MDEEAFPWAFRHFFPLRDVNTAEYEADPSWQRLAERRAHTHSGVDFWYGSLSERRLGNEVRIQLSADLTRRLRFRYLRESVANEEISAGSERLELAYRVLGPLSLTASGFGALEKSQAAFGFGAMIANADRTQYLDVTFRNDAIVFDDRTPYDATDPEPPFRVLAEGNFELPGTRFYGFADWGLRHRRVFESPRGSGGARERRDWTRRAELKLERAIGERALVGIRHRYSGQGEARELLPGYYDPEIDGLGFAFRRDHHRTDVFVESHFGARARMHAKAGFWRQTEFADFAVRPSYRLDRRQFIFGGRAIFTVHPKVELGAGYWGTYLDTKRTTGGTTSARLAWDPRNEEHYVDKVDGVVTYRWSDTMRFEGILSQEFTRGEFGGGCGKAIILF